MDRLFFVLILAALSVLAVGCREDNAQPSSNTPPPLPRPCNLETLRLHGGFQGALGSQFGAVTISTSAKRTCQLRSGRPSVQVYVADEPIPIVQTHSKSVRLSNGPRVVTIPIDAKRSGPGFAFEWQATCLPKGPISVRVKLPGSKTMLRVAHDAHIVGPRCQPGNSVIFVSLLGPDVAKLIVN